MKRDPLAPPIDETAAGAKPARRKRKGMRMGQATVLAGRAGSPTPAGTAIVSELAERERRQKARTLLEGGQYKGEKKGYGATAAIPSTTKET